MTEKEFIKIMSGAKAQGYEIADDHFFHSTHWMNAVINKIIIQGRNERTEQLYSMTCDELIEAYNSYLTKNDMIVKQNID